MPASQSRASGGRGRSAARASGPAGRSRQPSSGTPQVGLTRLSEAEFQKKVTDLCDWLRLKWHHETDSRRSKAGFPDLVVAGPGGLVFLELKAEKGRVSEDQRSWIAALMVAGQDVRVIRPSDWDTVVLLLTRLARG